MNLKKTFKKLKYKGVWGYYAYQTIYKIHGILCYKIYSDEQITKKKYKEVFHRTLDLKSPQTLNEKIQWLKLYERNDFHTLCADKYAVREYLKEKFGEEYLIPLVYHTPDWRKITIDCLPDYPCIVKANHTSGNYVIIRDKYKVNLRDLQTDCRSWMAINYYTVSQEWQYKNIKRQIVIEKLLETKEGHIPNDYKLHYINGKLQFVYVSVDREGSNKRNIYDANWRPLYFTWVESYKDIKNLRGKEIDPPLSFNKMKEIGEEIAQHFKYVRVDFYDVDGKLYFGEITLHHGGGFDVFTPQEYDFKYGAMLQL